MAERNMMATLVLTLLIPLACGTSEKGTHQDGLWPVNTAVVHGQTASLTCEQSNLAIWSVCTSRDQCTQISRGDSIIIEPGDRYSITSSGNIYKLNISNVAEGDGAKYLCEPFFGDGTYGELIVVENDFSCTIEGTNGISLVENTTYSLSCQVSYSGRWAPSMRCKTGVSDWLLTSDESTPTRGQYSVLFTATRDMDSTTIGCELYFDFPRSWEDMNADEANNEPEIKERISWSSPAPMNIQYAPHDVSISPHSAIIEVSTVLTCSASANPTPSYIWYDVTSGKILGQESYLSINSDQIGVMQIKCEASNLIGGQYYIAISTKEILICEKDICQSHVKDNTSAIVGSVLGVLFAISLGFNLFLLFKSRTANGSFTAIFYKRSRNKDKTSRNDPVPVPTVSTNIGVSSLRPGQSNYQYIDDNDVSSLSGTMRGSRLSISGTSPLDTIYEPVAARYSNASAIRNSQLAEMTTPTTRDQPTSDTTSNQNQGYLTPTNVRESLYSNQSRPGSNYSFATNLTFRDDDIVTSPRFDRYT